MLSMKLWQNLGLKLFLTRPVRVIRLIGKNTVEQIILNRAEEKLKLTDKVIESGEFSAAGTSVSKPAFVKNSKQVRLGG